MADIGTPRDPFLAEMNRMFRLRIGSRKRGRRLAALGLLVAGLLPIGAAAQTTEPLLPGATPPTGPQAPAVPGQPTFPGETVTTRARPEYDPIGLRFGDFFWFPRAELDQAYNSNIFATPKPTYDLVTTLQPGFDLLSSFPRNELGVHGSAPLQFFWDHPAQNTQDGYLNVDGRYDVTAGSSLYGNASVAHSHLAYGSPNTPGGIAQPLTYNEARARAGYSQGGRRITYSAEFGVDATQFNSVPLVGGATLAQSSSNTIISEAALRAGYEFIPDYTAYIRAAGDFYAYPHTFPGSTTRNNSEVYRTNLGLQIAPRHLLYGEVYVGFLTQNFVEAGLPSTFAPDLGGHLTWNITPLTTLTFNGLRTFIPANPTIGVTGAGYLQSVFSVNADHELLRNVLLNLGGSIENDSFQGTSRTDNVFAIVAGVRYLLNRNLFLGGNYYVVRR
ncbi:MAG: outer membrane beta-barrel protein, partial [Alphaproteobacteria bacterium]|nr:outer membrane beta-barrel protein [Alphaproteobacteria bacterium]